MAIADCAHETSGPRVSVAESLEPAIDAWRHLEARCPRTPFQSLAWHRAVIDGGGAVGDIRIVVGHDDDGSPVFLLPLALTRLGPLNILRWLSGPQASYGGGLFDPGFAARLDRAGAMGLVARIAAALPRADALVLSDQRDDMPANPLRLLPRIAGASEGYSVTLGSWDEVYTARNNRRARHNDRRREKRLAEIAPWRVRFAGEAGDRARLAEVMFAQKRAWLRAQGIDDFLADPGTRALLARVIGGAPDAGLEPVVAALEVGGEVAAVSFALIHDRRCYSLITSVSENEALHRQSPGDILFRHLMAAMCERGIADLDLGIGANTQKEHYADRRFRLFHTLVPLTAEGRVYTATIRARTAAKRAIKESPALWSAFQHLRRLRGAIDGLIGRTA